MFKKLFSLFSSNAPLQYTPALTRFIDYLKSDSKQRETKFTVDGVEYVILRQSDGNLDVVAQYQINGVEDVSHLRIDDPNDVFVEDRLMIFLTVLLNRINLTKGYSTTLLSEDVILPSFYDEVFTKANSNYLTDSHTLDLQVLFGYLELYHKEGMLRFVEKTNYTNRKASTIPTTYSSLSRYEYLIFK